MKRDLGLIRQLLLKLEVFPKDITSVVYLRGCEPEIQVSEYNQDQIYYHLKLIAEANLILPIYSHASLYIPFERLSWSGHDFIDAVRSQGVWEITKKQAESLGGSFTLDLIKQLAIGFFKKQIEDKTGMKL